MGRSWPTLHPNLSCGGRLPCPTLPAPNHLLGHLPDQGCRGECWPRQRAHRRGAIVSVLVDRKLWGSYAYPKPCLGIFNGSSWVVAHPSNIEVVTKLSWMSVAAKAVVMTSSFIQG